MVLMTGAAKKKLVLTLATLVKQMQNCDESYLHVNKKGICKFKANDNKSWYNFCLGSVSKVYTKDERSEIV